MAIEINKGLKKYIPIFRTTHEQAINEAETSLRISKFFEDVLGYDVFTEISKEHMIKDRYVDYAITIKGRIAFLVEVKQAGIKLKERHSEQASNYAANSGVPWVLLTNGKYWLLYHLTFDEGIQSDLVWSVDLLEDNPKVVASKIALLHKKNVQKGALENYLAKVKTLSPKSIVRAIFHEDTLKVIGKLLRRMSGVRVDEQDLADNIKKMLSKKAWEEIGDVKIKRKRKATRTKQAAKEAAPTPAQQTPIIQPPQEKEIQEGASGEL
ncbi:MAG: type I restriction enzyme HsdR N-terminal domain-containing protein [Candidatus Brocadiales bacterium]|nr:type I restriction enzyme HsdR N-terminal domain-containing protein [Candidatus Bathyanammoxibius amoris]